MQPELFEQMEDIQQKHFWFRARSKIIQDQIAKILNIGDRVLDAGCGTGLLLSSFPIQNHLAGLDISSFALALAANRLKDRHADLREGHLPDNFPFTEQSQDLILLTDVLEHIEDDQKTLQILFQTLRPGGHLLLTVPAYKFLWSKHDEEHGHFRRYRKTPLKNLLLKSGFRVPRITYFNFLLFPLVLFVRIVKKLFNDHGGDMDMPKSAVNNFLFKIFSLERGWLKNNNFPWGVSLLVIAQKPH
jgi:SAM-dependent methyltransferase